jgi:Holliday junction resolvase RusA-like endonuclease
MSTVTFEVLGDPVAKGRPKFCRRGNFVHTYTPTKTRKAENAIGTEALKHRPAQPFPGPLSVQIDVFRARPKSMTKRERMTLRHPIKKPDADNYAKLILDALNGIMWLDDAQVVDLRVRKMYDNTPRCEIAIKTIDEYRYNAHADRVGGTE